MQPPPTIGTQMAARSDCSSNFPAPGQRPSAHRQSGEKEDPHRVGRGRARPPHADPVDHRVKRDDDGGADAPSQASPRNSSRRHLAAGDQQDAAGNAGNPHQSQRRQNFAKQNRIRECHEQRRGAPHDGIGQAQIGAPIDPRDQGVIGKLRDRGGGNERPARGAGAARKGKNSSDIAAAPNTIPTVAISTS